MDQTDLNLTDNEGPATTGCAFRQRPDLSFEHIGPQIERLTGVPAERWLREPELFWTLLVAPETVRRQMVRAASAPAGLAFAFDLRHALTGHPRWIADFRRPVLDGQGRLTAFDGVWLGLEPLDDVEARLVQAAWTEVLSAITMGVVHDFNNALTGILSLSEFFLMKVDAQHPFHEGLTLVKQNTHKAAQLAHTLLRLHHDRPGKRECRDLSQVAGDLEDILRRTLPKRIQLTCQWLATPLPVEVDAVELQHVIVHLAFHAAHAVPDHGTVRFETSLHQEPPTLQHFIGVQPRAAAACLAVASSGPGLPEGALESVPDLSSNGPVGKAPAKQGLWPAKRFVETHGGALSVEPNPDQGRTLRLWLPFINLE